jgi:hypothetical protein
MGAEKLIGGSFEACRFSRSSYSFEVVSNGQVYHLGTNYSVSTKLADMLAKKDAGADISKQIWDLLECELAVIEQLEKHHALRLEFSEGGEIFIWSDDEPNDNLAVVRNTTSGEWFTIG